MMFLGLRDRPLVHISMPMQVIITSTYLCIATYIWVVD